MDLLETVLRSADAQEYVELFRFNKIESGVLPLLTDQDLQILGVEEKALRDKILQKTSNLQIPHEKLFNILLTKDDVELILNQIAYQLNLHHAALSCALIRKDVVVCDLKLSNATKCLRSCIDSIEKRLDDFEAIVNPNRMHNFNRKALFAIGATSVFLLIFGKFFKYF